MGTSEIRVAPERLEQAATAWRGLSSGFSSVAPPSAGQPFQPTTAAISAIGAAIGVGGAACAARIQDTAAGVTAAAGGYTNQDATGTTELGAVAPPIVMV